MRDPDFVVINCLLNRETPTCWARGSRADEADGLSRELRAGGVVDPGALYATLAGGASPAPHWMSSSRNRSTRPIRSSHSTTSSWPRTPSAGPKRS